MLYKRAYEQKLPELKGYLEIIKNNSIENQPCNCDLGKGGNHNGCQSVEVPTIVKKVKTLSPEQQEVQTLIETAITENKPKEEIDALNKRLEELKTVKKEVYEAPSGLTSIAITISDVSKRLFRKIAGIGIATSPPPVLTTEEIDDIVMGGLEDAAEYEDLNDEYTDELQNAPVLQQQEEAESIKDIVFEFLKGKDLNTLSTKDVRRHVKEVTGVKPDKAVIKEIIESYQEDEEVEIEGIDDF
jgi:hypothetical protein